MKQTNTSLLIIIRSDLSSLDKLRRPHSYEPPHLLEHGELGSLIHGASWKGVDSNGQIDPDNAYPV